LTEPSIHRLACWALIAAGVLTAASLRFVTAPYGRHERSGWGPRIPSRLGWILMEAPASLAFLGLFLAGDHRFETAPLVLLALWQLHYVHRAFLFPFRMRVTGKTMPASVALMAIFFNGWNAYINARWISHLGDYPTGWLVGPRFLVGAGLFLSGWAINLWADTVLLRLRKPGETGYKIPRGGLYELVACPNYLGEILEWTGWAVLTWSLPGLAFALYTAANVGPRAASHLAWYREKFPEYPRERKALIPFVW
jgi:protein-S-isoprenylcysteine O-methyltransferase Ste14